MRTAHLSPTGACGGSTMRAALLFDMENIFEAFSG
jgi:5-methylcytosine-specific restriction endonuclease McrBC regulatory subunit McrC